MKKLLIVLGSLIFIIIAAAVLVPIIFKDDIKVAVDKAIAESVNADVVWDADDFSISLFSNFPNATAGLNNLGVINRAPFEGQLLVAFEKFEVEVDIFSLLGDQIKIKGIEIDNAEVNIKVLEDGSANYDIVITDETAIETPADSSASGLNIGIDHWQITNAHIVYEDATLPFKLELKNVNHSGSGDLAADVFDLSTNTTSDSVSVTFDGVEYVSNKKLQADVVMSISDDYSKYTFKENTAKLNEFSFGFDGFLALLDDGSMDMDITYNTKESTFKSLMSLVPGVYSKDFESIETEGKLTFNGAVKGKYDSLNLPAFNLNLQVADAMFKYPDLPTAVRNIKMDLRVDNPDGVIENTMVDLKEFHMDLGNNPIDAAILIKNLRNYDMNANIDATLNIGELSKMVPMEGISAKGIFAINLKAEGVYDSLTNKFPIIASTMSLKNGYVKTGDLPYALEGLKFNATIDAPTGKMQDFKAVIKDFAMTMDGEPFTANLTLANLDNYTWDVSVAGGIDLEKITKVFPLEGMQIAGAVKADLSTKGKMSDLEAERYANLPTSGSLTVNNFKYVDAELPYDVTLSNVKASFNPQQVNLENLKGTIGKSDMSVNGSISNYIGYLFGENQTIKGTVNFQSNLLDLNEFMSEEDDAAVVTTEEEASYGVIQVPENIDFVLKSSIKQVKMMDFNITNAKGDIIVKNGIASLRDLKFNLLEGQFAVNGSYNAKDKSKPMYDFNLDIDELSINKAFTNFSVVKQYVPIADKVNGGFSTDFNISGLLGEDMLPNLATVVGKGIVNIQQASVQDAKIVSLITNLTKLDNTSNVTIKDVLMSVTIEDGNLIVKPFDINLGNYKTTIAGTTALDGGIDFSLKMDVPAGKLGSQFNSFIGGGTSDNTTIPVKIGLGGTYDNPKPKLMMDDQKSAVKDAVKDKVKEEAKDALLDNVKSDKAKDAISNILGGKDSKKTKEDSIRADSLKKAREAEVKRKLDEEKKKLEEEAKDKIKGLFKKKKDGGN